tara:strand:+ start:799 stop:1206 length:408 start_codon:yes stop_codon:yes gene_type:complete
MKIGDENNKYERGEVTNQDLISEDVNEIKTRLQGFVQIHEDNYKDIDIGIWVRYISDEGKYRTGGILVHNKAPEYFVLKNPNNEITWSVNLKKNIIFMKDIGAKRDQMIEKNNLYRLYLEGYVKILDEPDPDFFQ